MPDSNVQFRVALRGYDRTQVDQHLNQQAQGSSAVWQEAAERTLRVGQLEAANTELKGELARLSQRALALEEAQMEATTPTYEGLGARIIAILALADTESRELRTHALADAANERALAEENALATRQDSDDYATKTRSDTDDEAAKVLKDARAQASGLLGEAMLQADSLLDDAREKADALLNEAEKQAMARQDADRQAMAMREEAEAVYERARASSAAAAVDFETTLAARRDTSAVEFAAQVHAAEQQLSAVRERSERTRNQSEQAQREAGTKCAQQLEQAMASAQTLVTEATTKAERIRDNSERELTAATQRRNNINAQLTIIRRDLAALGGVARFNPVAADGLAENQAWAAAFVDATEGEESADSAGQEVAADTRNGATATPAHDGAAATQTLNGAAGRRPHR